MSEQEERDLSPALQDLMSEMARMRTELTELKSRADTLAQPVQSLKTNITSTRRNTLKRLGLALLGGVATAGVIGAAPSVQAKVTAHPQGSLANKAGLLVVPPGAADPIGTPPTPSLSLSLTSPSFTYGLIASGDNPTTLNLSDLPEGNTGIYGTGNTGVYGNGTVQGIYGNGTSYGVYGNGYTGIYGKGATGVNGSGTAYGVYGSGPSGVYGEGTTYGVNGSGPTGVYGNGDTGVYGNGTLKGVYGNGGNGTGVYGKGITGISGSGILTGVSGTASATGATGVSGTGTGSQSFGVVGSGTSIGVYGGSPSGSGGYFKGGNISSTGAIGDAGGGATSGNTNPHTAIGLVGNSGKNYNLSALNDNYNIGVYGTAAGNANNYAGFFEGNVYVSGTINKAGGTFKIDHPLDPENKYLYHSFVESPDMMNIYNGLVTLDEQGEATVTMPDWFEALNSDFRYQLTCLDQYAPVYIAKEINDRIFKIAGGMTGQRVSWQVTGIRQDAWAKANRILVEEDKTGDEKGKYLHPEVFG